MTLCIIGVGREFSFETTSLALTELILSILSVSDTVTPLASGELYLTVLAFPCLSFLRVLSARPRLGVSSLLFLPPL